MKRKLKILLFILLFLSSTFYIFFYSEDSFFYLLKLKGTEKTIQEEIFLLSQENNRLVREIQNIKGDTFFLEKVAREELGLVKKDELVIFFQ